MFGWDQKERLLRESWSADSLAEELYAMFGENVPNNTGAPVVVNNPNGNNVAPVQLQNIKDGDTIITTRRTDGSTGDRISIDGGVLFINDMPVGTGGGTGGGGGGVPVWG